ncbi:hypothetical protein EDB81DRAFT_764531 [Dactylonectria macrodidyma]|uniref:Uncharacterized protein n=1 Tax=Dactylonectria macrodidyma TaxID=307937 RepID=A0A9P9DXT3_9HYPO|nr:hypothetical protein EDB81DRAFT_764531 [Dactylonectria macrodidyma]
MKSGFRALIVFKWMSQKSYIEVLQPQMDHIKIQLQLLMSGVIFETRNLPTEAEGRRSEAEEALPTEDPNLRSKTDEIPSTEEPSLPSLADEDKKLLQNIIRRQMRRIKILEYQLFRNHESFFHPLRPTESSSSIEQDHQSLSDGGRSIINSGSISQGSLPISSSSISSGNDSSEKAVVRLQPSSCSYNYSLTHSLRKNSSAKMIYPSRAVGEFWKPGRARGRRTHAGTCSLPKVEREASPLLW